MVQLDQYGGEIHCIYTTQSCTKNSIVAEAHNNIIVICALIKDSRMEVMLAFCYCLLEILTLAMLRKHHEDHWQFWLFLWHPSVVPE